MLLAAHQLRREILGSRSRFVPSTVAPGQTPGVLRIASSILHIPSQATVAPDSDAPEARGRKAAQEHFSEESFRLTHSRKRASQKLHHKLAQLAKLMAYSQLGLTRGTKLL